MGLPLVSFPTLGFQVAAWMEFFLCHGKGDLAGEPWEIDDEFLLFLCWAYRLWPEAHRDAGRRLVRRAVLSRPKGRAKSEIAGGVVCAEGLGPVRFSHWAEEGEASDWGYQYQLGEPVGQPVHDPFIRCLATEEDQSGNTYDNVYVMLLEGRAADEFGLREGKEVGLTRTFLPTGGEIRPSTAGDASKDGGLETFAVADETHLYVKPSLRTMYRTVARNTGKRKISQPWMLDTTTMFRLGERSVAEVAHENYADADIEKTVTARGVLFDHRQGDEPKRFNDDRSLAKAIRSGYGPAAEWIDDHGIVQIIRGADDPEEEAYRYYLNRKRKRASQWLKPDEIKAALEEFDVPLGEKIGVGFDGSETDDHTVLFGCLENGDVFTIGVWVPPGLDGHTGWRADVMDAVEWTFENFTVVRFNGDPAWWQEEMSKWAGQYGTPPKGPVAEFWTGGRSESKMAVATGATATAIRHGMRINPNPLRTPQLYVGNDNVARENAGTKPIVQWELENTRTRKVRVKREEAEAAEDVDILRKERRGSPLKIDCATGIVLARRARDDAVKLGLFEKKKPSRVVAWQ